MLSLLLREPIAIFANDIRKLGFHVLNLLRRETTWIGSLSSQLMGGSERRSRRKNGSGGNSSLLAKLAPGDPMTAVIVRRLGHGEAWSCIPYPRVNQNLPIARKMGSRAFYLISVTVRRYRLGLEQKPVPTRKNSSSDVDFGDSRPSY